VQCHIAAEDLGKWRLARSKEEVDKILEVVGRYSKGRGGGLV